MSGLSDPSLDRVALEFANNNGIVPAAFDYTSSEAANYYATQLNTVLNFFNTPSVNSAGQPQPVNFSDADGQAASQALQNLVNAAEHGFGPDGQTPPAPGAQPVTYFTTMMVTNLDLLIRTFQAAGATDPLQGITGQQLTTWKDFSMLSTSIQNILNGAVNAAGPANKSLQSMLELEYVGTANQLINAQLQNLQQALSTTNGVLATLGNIQNIHNDVIVLGRGTIPFDYANFNINNCSTFYEGAYTGAASTQFGQPINPTVSSIYIVYGAQGGPLASVPLGVTAAGQSIFNKLMAIKVSLIQEIKTISGLSTPTVLANPNSLYNTLKVVLGGMRSQFGATINGVYQSATSGFTTQQEAVAIRNWILDRYNLTNTPSSANAGIIQQNITLAITAAQSLNNQQQENVQNFIFVFEEYYKSASALLQSITQIIEKMAQGVSGQ